MQQPAETRIKFTGLIGGSDEVNVGIVRDVASMFNVACDVARCGSDMLQLFSRVRHDLVILDVQLANMNVLRLIPQLLCESPLTDIIVIDEGYSVDGALCFARAGVSDYLEKPVSVNRLRQSIGSIVDKRVPRVQRSTDAELEAAAEVGIVGRSPSVLHMLSELTRLAGFREPVLLTGYTGSGKELAARFLHRQSGRKGPFAAVNAAAIPEHLAESELFGHVKGAFTGADRDQTGIFEYGNRGTVFLDEIGELPLNLQAKLLRVLETRQVRRLGSPRPVDLDIRVIAATNRNLREEVREKRFREDLYYRLSAAEVRIPTLRERMEDLPLLERLFIERFRRDHTSQLAGITPRAQLILSAHQWPGNIRELENVIAYACLHASGMMIDSADLPETLNRPPLSPLDSIDEVVRKYVESVVERMGGSKTRAAEALGIDRATVYRLLNKPK